MFVDFSKFVVVDGCYVSSMGRAGLSYPVMQFVMRDFPFSGQLVPRCFSFHAVVYAGDLIVGWLFKCGDLVAYISRF